jgi:hypothetical protein
LTVVPFKSIDIYPAGTNGKLDVAKVADAPVVADMFAPAKVTFPKIVTVEPKVMVVLPIITLLFAKPLLGIVTEAVTALVLLAYIYPVKLVTVNVVTLEMLELELEKDDTVFNI